MSFKETYFKYYPELVRYGKQLRLEESGMEDLVQETFLRYHLELGKKVIFRNKRAWLYKVFHNLALIIGIFLIAKNGTFSRTLELNEAELLYLDLMGDMEPNRTWNEGQTLLILSDKDGEIIQSFTSHE